MEIQKPKIALYAKRPFGAKLDASFGFIRENLKPLLKYFTYLILPLCLIQGINMNGLLNSLLETSALQTVGNESVDALLLRQGVWLVIYYAGLIFFSWIGSVLMISLVYALIRLYNDRDDRLNGVTFSELRPLLWRNTKRLMIFSIWVTVLCVLIAAVVAMLAMVSAYTLLLSMAVLLAAGIPLALLAPVYLFEDLSFITAFKKTYRLGFATWGGIFLMLLIMGGIAAILQGVCSLPWYVVYCIHLLFSLSDGSMDSSSVGFSFLQYLFSILMLYGTYMSAVLTMVGLAFQYGHASELVESTRLESDIDNFENL